MLSNIVTAIPEIDSKILEKLNNNSEVYVTIVLKHTFANNYSDNYLKYRVTAGTKQLSDFLLTIPNNEFEAVQKVIE